MELFGMAGMMIVGEADEGDEGDNED